MAWSWCMLTTPTLEHSTPRLIALALAFTKANLERIANTPVSFSEEQMVDVEKIIEKIEDDDDRTGTFTRILVNTFGLYM